MMAPGLRCLPVGLKGIVMSSGGDPRRRSWVPNNGIMEPHVALSTQYLASRVRQSVAPGGKGFPIWLKSEVATCIQNPTSNIHTCIRAYVYNKNNNNNNFSFLTSNTSNIHPSSLNLFKIMPKTRCSICDIAEDNATKIGIRSNNGKFLVCLSVCLSICLLSRYHFPEMLLLTSRLYSSFSVDSAVACFVKIYHQQTLQPIPQTTFIQLN